MITAHMLIRSQFDNDANGATSNGRYGELLTVWDPQQVFGRIIFHVANAYSFTGYVSVTE